MNQIEVKDPQNLTPIANCPDWRQAVDALLAFWIGLGRPFSSGEVAATLRVHRTDLRFKVTGVGEYIRDRFYSQSLPSYADDGSGQPCYPMQVPRLTVGKYPQRTPANVEVFVYAPTQTDGENHEFEIFIPNPGETMADAPTPAVTAPAPAAGSPAAVQILGAKTADIALRAKVYADDPPRLCVPRSAFELCVHLGGSPMRGGDPVYVKVTDTEAVVTLKQDDPTAKVYDLAIERGRVLFPSNDPTKPFVTGDTYDVKVTGGKIVVDLTKKC